MPILNIEIVGEPGKETRSNLAAEIADAAGIALGSQPHGTWVKLHFIPSENYAENAGGPPEGVLPVIASIIQSDPPHGVELQRQVSLLTDAIARCLERPRENIHIIVEAPAKGRIAFGGVLQ